MLPPGVESVNFQQKKNMVFVSWENGGFQSIRKVARRGRSTRAITVCFSPPTSKPSLVAKPSRPQDRLESGEY